MQSDLIRQVENNLRNEERLLAWKIKMRARQHARDIEFACWFGRR